MTLHSPPKKIDRTQFDPASSPKPYHAKLEGKLRPRGTITEANNVTNHELERLAETLPRKSNDTIIEEFAEGSHGRSVRFRQLDHPLEKAFLRKRITAAHFNAGDELRTLHEHVTKSGGRDSTDLERISSGTGACLSELAEKAGKKLRGIRDRMSKANWAICEKFCCEGFEPVEALRAAKVKFDEFRVTSRLCEALDALAGAPRARKRKYTRKVSGA
jgi:hypothetical protein